MRLQIPNYSLYELVNLIEKADTANYVLGPNDEYRKEILKNAMRLLHPDKYPRDAEKEEATKAFARLQELLAEESSKASNVFDVTTKLRTYNVSGLAYTGTVANLYNCRYARNGKMKDGLLKLPRNVRDSDLIQAEGKALKEILKSEDDRKNFFPRFEEMFKYRDKTTKKDRTALVLRKLPGFVSLAEIKTVFPDGLDTRDLAWAWRRSLGALSLLQEINIVHGAVLPEHILIQPEQHGVLLIGLTSTVASGSAVKILAGEKEFYAPEILNKEPATMATDIYMLHKTMESMLRADAPLQFRAFIKGCTFERPKVRPQDPLSILAEFDELLERLYGPRKFREFPALD